MAACVIFCAGCSAYRQPAPQGALVPDKNLRIAVLPIVNMSGKAAPLKGIRLALIQRVLRAGGRVLEDDGLERFMARHRVRYTGGIDTATAQALKDEAGIDAVLVTSLERYVDAGIPAIALTTRLVSTENMPPRILWMESSSLAGDDSPGVLGLGLISDIVRLQEKAIDRVTGSLAGFLSGKAAGGIGRGEWRFHPKLAYYTRFIAPGRKYRVAVSPFFNMSPTSEADEIVALQFIRQMVKSGVFDIIDPGVVREKLLKARVIMREGVSASDEDVLFNTMDADLILTGKVLNYDEAGGGAGPGVEFNVMIFERKSKKAAWASWSGNHGADGVFFFDWRWVNTAGALTSRMAKTVVRDMISLGSIKDARQLQENTVTTGTWAFMQKTFPAGW